MPADVDTFNMLRPNALAQLNCDQLKEEMQRAKQMRLAVANYENDIMRAMRNTGR